MEQEQGAEPKLVEEVAASIHDGIDRCRDLAKQTAQAIREQLHAESLADLGTEVHSPN